MLSNRDIARKFRLLGSIMDLLGENKFKIKSYQQAYMTLRKWNEPFSEMTEEQILEIPGVGKAISEKIMEMLETGTMQTLEKYLENVPEGVVLMLGIPGLGPAKVRLLWNELNYTTLEEVLIGCGENTLLKVKGFGPKLQAEIEKRIRFYLAGQGQLLLPDALNWAAEFKKDWDAVYPDNPLIETGDLRRRMPVVERITFLSESVPDYSAPPHWHEERREQNAIKYKNEEGITVTILPKTNFNSTAEALLKTTGPNGFSEQIEGNLAADSEHALFEAKGKQYLPAIMRDHNYVQDWLNGSKRMPEQLLEANDLKGLVHCHTTWSDGLHSVEEMAKHAAKLGYSYIVITDHSKAAFYANGLDEGRLSLQSDEIDKLNISLKGKITILKGIECDILNDGSMDFTADVLSSLDLVIASIHSNLNMEEEKAMNRLLRAIEHPNVHLLGHPTGRILLARAGYPVNHQKIIDACAANGVIIEINANPARLDLDWTWVQYAMEKGVHLSINPDAHSKEGMADNQYGVWMAQKGGLIKDFCANALELDDFLGCLKK
jgi:DNA polymerase (family X)